MEYLFEKSVFSEFQLSVIIPSDVKTRLLVPNAIFKTEYIAGGQVVITAKNYAYTTRSVT